MCFKLGVLVLLLELIVIGLHSWLCLVIICVF